VYSFVEGEGPGENTLKELDQKCHMVPQEEFLAQLRGATIAPATTQAETKRELPEIIPDSPKKVDEDPQSPAVSP
jgi:hypothetical protein